MARERTRSLRSRALSFLARRDHSRAELARKLAPCVEEGEAIEPLLDELAAKGWLSDTRFAEQSIRAKARRFGPLKLANILRAKGVDAEAIAAAFRAVGADGQPNIEGVWRSHFREPPGDARERARHGRFLQRRGFASEEIVRFLERFGRPR
jgi:regulatory protein